MYLHGKIGLEPDGFVHHFFEAVPEEHGRQLPEFAIADGIVQLMRKNLSTRDERFLRVLKLRGSGYIEGQHGFRITSDGIRVYPRLVSPEISKGYKSSTDRTSTGVAGLDEILGGGVLRGSTTLITGPTGQGRSSHGETGAQPLVRFARDTPGDLRNVSRVPT